MPITDRQRTEIQRLYKSNKTSKEIGAKLKLPTMTVAGVIAGLNRKSSTTKADYRKVALSIASKNNLSKNQIEDVVAFHNKTATAKHFINEIKGMKKSNPKVYNEILKGVKSLA